MSWRRVYQSGHTDTWCNGEDHVRTEGGWVWPDQTFEDKRNLSELYVCDCDFWRNTKPKENE